MSLTPCIQGLLDTDFYKLSMQQAYWHQAPHTVAEWEFRCRSTEDLTGYLRPLRNQLATLDCLGVSAEEIHWLRTAAPMLTEDYLGYLANFHLDPEQIAVSVEQNQLTIRAHGPQAHISLFEIPVMATLSEIRNRQRYPEVDAAQIERSTLAKIAAFQRLADETDLSGFQFSDFGTRRRFSLSAQRQVLGLLKAHLPTHLVGTSNPLLAREFQLPVVGTMAHEWLQTHQALGYPLAESQKAALLNWLAEFRGRLAVALTDVIGVDAFCRDLDSYLATHYSGFRQDSGDPVVWGEKLIARLEALGIDPADKTLVFSDALDFTRAVALYRHFHDRVRCSFGIGTWLMADFGLNQPLNMVMKMVRLDGRPVAKISDSPGKSLCQDREFLTHLMDSFAVEASVRHQVLSQVA